MESESFQYIQWIPDAEKTYFIFLYHLYCTRTNLNAKLNTYERVQRLVLAYIKQTGLLEYVRGIAHNISYSLHISFHLTFCYVD